MFEQKRKISSVAQNILKQRYFHDNESDWKDVVNRVVDYVLINEKDKNKKELTREMILNTYFIPNSPCLVNADKDTGGLCACFTVDFPDTIEGIYKTKLDFALIARKGGGCGTTLSKIRPEGDKVHGSTHGYAGGPIKFANTISVDAEALTQAGFRSMAIMLVMSVYHPDILKFITAKSEEGKIHNANISVMVDNAFMEKVINDETYWTEFNGVKYKEYKAREIFDLIVEGAWKNGEPGILFKDRINQSPYMYTGQEIFATNPCSEQPLPSNGVCNLGSFDLSKFLDKDKNFDFGLFEIAVRLGVNFLDTVVDRTGFPTKEIEQWASENRAIGIGVMGFADYCLLKEIPYGSKESMVELSKILSFMAEVAESESISLGKEKGIPLQCTKLPIPRRNITLTTVAPTGCQKKETLIVTDAGIFELAELGDIHGKKWQNINTNVSQEKEFKKSTRFFVNGKASTKKIKLSSGVELESTYNHQYRVLQSGNYIWKKAEDLEVGDLFVVPLGTYTSKHETLLKDCEPGYYNEKEYDFPKKVTKELAEFLGILFGDGSFHKKGIRLHFNSQEEDYLYVADLGKRVFGISPTISFDKRMNTVSVCFNSQKLLRWLKTNGFVKNIAKNIIFTRSIRSFNSENLQSFLDGFYFADGSHTKSVRYIDTASKTFAQQWVTISRALGKDCRISEHTSGLGSKIYRVYTVSTHRIIENKEIRGWLDKNDLTNCTVDSILSIENSENDTFDIEVLDNHCYIANGIMSHNTVSIIAGCSSGIEPIFSEIVVRNDKTGTYTFENDLASKPYFRCAVSANGATEVTWEEHVNILATAQKFIDSGVSKTINFPAHTRRETMADAFIMAWKSDCKGVAMYRNGSRKVEVLSPKNIKKNHCPKCDGELVEIKGKKKCVSCGWEDTKSASMVENPN